LYDSAFKLLINYSGSISTANGSALVRLGDTTVVCGVKAEIAEPDIDHPNDGFLGIARTSWHDKLDWTLHFGSAEP
jgi:exosome complex RNA-binding protein Rrp42 (RNase PH superfamily)